MEIFKRHKFHREHYKNHCLYCKLSEHDAIHKVRKPRGQATENDKSLLHSQLEDQLAHVISWHGPSVYTIIDEIVRQGWTPPKNKRKKKS